jgi:monoamine oxidase
MSEQSASVVIVGGGFSGIAAAKKLQEAGQSFMVLEARERLGGRVFTKRFDNDLYLDFGGQWIGPTQDRMYELCHELGVSYFETYNEGKNILDLGKKLKTYRGTIPKLDLFSLLNLDWLIRKLEKLAQQIDPKAPWKHLKAKDWDGQNLDEFLQKNSKTKACYQVIRLGCETIFACDPHQLSLLHALFYIRSGTSLDCLINVKGGAQQHRIKGGMQTLIEAMAKPFLDQIRFQSPVKSITHSPFGVRIQGEDFSIEAKKVILAVPPPLLAEITFTPALPTSKINLLQNYPMGRVAKCFMIYERPFWRADGFSGQSVSDDKTPFQTLYDCSPADAGKGVLMGFVVGSRAEQFFSLEKNARKEKMTSVLSRYFGEKAKEAIDYQEFSMTDDSWARGCYAALMQKNAWTDFQDAYRSSVPPLYFAGTEAAIKWHGYIEGAVLAGEAAASDVLRSLKHD